MATLKNLILRERSILYEMIARFVPIGTTAKMVVFLQAFIAEEKNGNISQDIFDSLLQLANGYYNGRRAEDRYFDHKWEEVILILKNGGLFRS